MGVAAGSSEKKDRNVNKRQREMYLAGRVTDRGTEVRENGHGEETDKVTFSESEHR